LAAKLRRQECSVEVLDGDEVRPYLSQGLGFARSDRETNVLRIGWVAELLAHHGVLVLVAVIAPYADVREAVRQHHACKGTSYVEVHVATPLDVASRRDTKGLYAKARLGEIRNFTGVDDPYEEPIHPDVRIATDEQTVDESVAILYRVLLSRGYVVPAQ
jgi:adenylylsulfate kinase